LCAPAATNGGDKRSTSANGVRPTFDDLHLLGDTDMNSMQLLRTTLVASMLVLTGAAANAQGDIYSRLAQMHQKMMKTDASAMVSKEEYLGYVSTAWDMKADEMKAKDGKLTQAQLKDLEMALGRMVSH
jgi:hypothetical protein